MLTLIISSVAFKFGLITMLAGLLGVPLGSYLSQKLKKRYASCDPVICAFGLLLSAPLLTGACLIVSRHTLSTYILIFFGQLALNLNWAIVADILLVRRNLQRNLIQSECTVKSLLLFVVILHIVYFCSICFKVLIFYCYNKLLTLTHTHKHTHKCTLPFHLLTHTHTHIWP